MCVRGVLIGMKELCRENSLNEVFTAYLVGRLAIDLIKLVDFILTNLDKSRAILLSFIDFSKAYNLSLIHI